MLIYFLQIRTGNVHQKCPSIGRIREYLRFVSSGLKDENQRIQPTQHVLISKLSHHSSLPPRHIIQRIPVGSLRPKGHTCPSSCVSFHTAGQKSARRSTNNNNYNIGFHPIYHLLTPKHLSAKYMIFKGKSKIISLTIKIGTHI